jgi:hypothetical protein
VDAIHHLLFQVLHEVEGGESLQSHTPGEDEDVASPLQRDELKHRLERMKVKK